MTSVHLKFLLMTWIGFILVSCGGGSSAKTTTITKEDLIGTYNLSKFKVSYNNGKILTETTQGVNTYFGSLRINSNDTFSQLIQIDEVITYTNGTYAVNENNELLITAFEKTYTVSLSLSNETLKVKTLLGATSLNPNFDEEDTWQKINSEEPATLTLEDLAGTYKFNSYYIRSGGNELYPLSTTVFTGTMTIDTSGNINQEISINGSQGLLTGQLIVLSEKSLLLTTTVGEPSTLLAHYDGKYFATVVTASSTQVEFNIWEKDPN